MNAPTEFDVFGCPLDGTTLIEASAGTGKTWALCGLYLRLLLERGLDVQHVLVVTFTNAATAELRERIRSRIAETLAHLKQGADARATADAGSTADPFVARLVATLRRSNGLADTTLITRLELALHAFDEAAIFTIHGFCQRALADTPFSAQMPLALELVQDDAEFVSEAATDFWRRHLAGDALDPALAAWLAERKDSPDKFAKLLKRHLAKPLALARWPQAIDDAPAAIDALALNEAHNVARALWQSRREGVVACVLQALPALNRNSYKTTTVDAAALGWDALLAGSDAVAALALAPPKIDLLGSARLKARKGHTAPEHPFFSAAQRLLDLRNASQQTLALTRLALLRRLFDEGSLALRSAKRQRRVVAYDDMLFNLHERLHNGDAPWLAASLRARFPAALIDEFQDTDPLQFAIFKAIYGAAQGSAGPPQVLPGFALSPSVSRNFASLVFLLPLGGADVARRRPWGRSEGAGPPLFLVGDPKQAIYSFRNADLHTYLQARAEASAEFTLQDNQRATEPLIGALNGLFGTNDQAFMLPGLGYRRAGFGAKPRKLLRDATLARAPLQVWTLPSDPVSGEPLLSKPDAQAAAVAATAGEIARLIAAGRQGRISLAEQPLRAGDIAVLVRSHAHGSAVRQALSALGVGSALLSQASIYRSPDAEELERLLAAALEPTREGLLKAALATSLMGLDAVAIAALAVDEAQMLRWVQRFAACRDTWLQRGVGTMLRELMRSERLPERLLARPDGERRLTNLLHLAECLHQAAEVHAAPDALRRWFQTRRLDERSDDATQLRLESDHNLVQIVTIHKAKGLEYAVVFCPLLWDGRRGGFADGLDGVEYHGENGHTVIDYRKGFAGEFNEPQVKRIRQLESAAEDLRLIYVALTRAVQRCVLVAGGYLANHFGKTSPTEGARSLLNWLVAGQGQAPEAWFKGAPAMASITAAWAALAARCGDAMNVAPLPPTAGARVPADDRSADALAALEAPRHIPPGWRIGSYSALMHGAAHELAAADHDLRVAAAPVLAAAVLRLDDDDILRFARGAAAGECIHAVFEHSDFSARASWPGAIDTALQRHGAALPTVKGAAGAAAEALWAPMLQRMLHDVLATPLPVGTAQPLRLAGVPPARRLTELEFHLPSHRLDAEALNAVLAEWGYAVPRLAFGALRGYLKGFIDLVLEHDGRYFIVDWKSNHLGDTAADYAAAPLADAMAAQGYHLQALLYSVALDRLLRQRLANYDAAQHFGGVLYLFVRGVRPGWMDERGTPAGLHFQRPAVATIRRLSALFDAAEAGA